LYYTSISTRVIKLRRMRWAGMQCACERRELHTKFWWENLKERDHWEYLDVDRNIILQEVLGRTNRLLSFDTIRTA
jgi:hypothetical protein